MIGFIGKVGQARKFSLWNLEEGCELSSFDVTETEKIIMARNNFFLLDIERNTMRNARTGVYEEAFTMEPLADQKTYVSSYCQLAIQ